MSKKLSLLLCLILVCLTMGTVPSWGRDKRVENLPVVYQDWLQEVDLLLTRKERKKFLELDQDYQRDAFVRKFWEARDPYPETSHNEFQIEWMNRLEEVRLRFGSISVDRAQYLLLNGEPTLVTEALCKTSMWPSEIWFYAVGQGERVSDPLYLVFYQPFGGGTYRLWHPTESYDVLFSVTVPEEFNELARVLESDKLCGRNDETREILRALASIYQRGDLRFESLAAAARTAPPPQEGDWVLELDMASTRLDPDAEPLAASVSMRFPRRERQRTVTEALVEIDLQGEGAGTASRVGDGDSKYSYRIAGELFRDGELFETFRYRFDFLEEEVTSPQLPLVFVRHLRPGPFELVIKVEELHSSRQIRLRESFEVPDLAGEEKAEFRPGPEEPEGPVQAIRILPPEQSLLTGVIRFAAEVNIDSVKRVRFLLDGKVLLIKARPPFSVALDLGSLPRTRTVTAEAVDGKGELLASDSLVINGGPHRFAVELAARTHSGETLEVVAEVDVPQGLELDRLEIYREDTLMATLYQEPWTVSVPLSARPPTFVRGALFLADGNLTEDLVFLDGTQLQERLDVQYVELHVAVVDSAGRPVTGIERGQLEIFEDDVQQKILRFEAVTELPIHVGLLIDISGSMVDRLPVAQQAALSFVERTIRPRDRASVFTFNEVTRQVAEFTNDPQILAGSLGGLRASGETALFDALVFSLHHFAGLKGQRALLLLSDGSDRRSRYTFGEAREFAYRAGVSLYTIGVDILAANLEAKSRLSRLADETGGRSFFIKNVDELDSIYRLIEDDLRSRYLLAYQSSSSADLEAFRVIRVEVAGRGLEAATLAGYYP